MACDFSAFNFKSFLAIHAATSIMHVSIIYCFGGVGAAASTIVEVAIAKFGSYVL